eukprot:CAMPEP_0197039924 /NCGR_PEP_ID=MMETSP1384-20130603/16692_1 /TAXON_ID=29189 /ORGANISM="Ammonia sp." /LENGTH=532 /DNA_ID=CAMNT_0042470599 /DNA_START=56 /DNA_END=1654 /DNA_ORIENTATION=+
MAQGEEGDDIWKELFGDNSHSASPKKGHTTLISKNRKSSRTRPPVKKRKLDHRAASSSSTATDSQSAGNGHDSRATDSSSYGQQQHQHQQQPQHEGPSTVERLSQFLCTPKYRARLPSPPLRCKFLTYPHEKNRFTKYCASSLELNYNWEMHHDSLFPLPLDLMDPDYYNPLKRADPNNDDEGINHTEDNRIRQLLEDREYRRTAKEEHTLPEQEAFLLQTQYLTGGQEYELTELQRKEYDATSRKRRDSRSSNKRYREFDDEDVDNVYGGYKSRRQAPARHNAHSLDNVKQTFIDVQNITRHPIRGVKVEKAFDVFPHEVLLDYEYTHIQFDNNPVQHIKKCNFMPKYKEERMQKASECVNECLLRCVNQKGIEKDRLKQSKQENDDEDDEDEEEAQRKKKEKAADSSEKDPDWFSLYATDGSMRVNEEEESMTKRFEWTAEYVPSGWQKEKRHFILIPKDGNTEHDEVMYGNYENRISLRHRPTDLGQEATAGPLSGSKKSLSEHDRKFFKLQAMNVKLTLPHSSNAEYE